MKSMCFFLKEIQKQSPEVFWKNGVFKNFAKFTEKQVCWSIFINFIKKETPKQLFSCEF